MLGIQPFPSWIMVIAWLVYLVPMVIIVAWPGGRGRKQVRSQAVPADSSALAEGPALAENAALVEGPAPDRNHSVEVEGAVPREH